MTHRDPSDDLSFYDRDMNQRPGVIADDVEDYDEDLSGRPIDDTDCLLETARKVAAFTARRVAEIRAEAEKEGSS